MSKDITQEKPEDKNLYRFYVMNKQGQLEKWTGSFKTIKKAQIYFEKEGVQWEKKGRVLYLVQVVKNEEIIVENWRTKTKNK